MRGTACTWEAPHNPMAHALRGERHSPAVVSLFFCLSGACKARRTLKGAVPCAEGCLLTQHFNQLKTLKP